MANAAGKQVQALYGKYMAINALSRRIRALQSGHKPLVNRPATNLPTVAVEEFLENKLTVRAVAREEKMIFGAADAEAETRTRKSNQAAAESNKG